MHGTRTANYAMDNADLIVAIGARFDDRITGKLAEFAPRAKFVHIDIDPAEISKNVPAHIPIVGDSKRILPKLTAEYRALEADRSRMDEWWAQLRRWQDEWPLKFEGSKDGDIPPQRMIQALYEVTGGNAILTSDVGQHQMWTAQHFHFPGPRRWINSGGLGTMGFGLPSAIGAKVAKPDELVVCVAGDGSLVMTCQELATAVEHDIDVKVFIMNNGYLGMVRQWQELFWDKRYSSVDMGSSPDWVKLAEAFGARGMRVEADAEVEDAMREAIETEGPVVLDVRVRKEENCYPMIPAGAAARDMVGCHGRARNKRSPAPRGPRGRGQHPYRPQARAVGAGREQARRADARSRGCSRGAGSTSTRSRSGPTEDESVSRVTITLDGASHPIDQVTKQLHKLVNVIKIRDLEPEETIAREMALFKVSADGSSRAEIMQLADIFRGRIIDVSSRTVTIEMTGTADKIEGFESMVRPFGLVEMVRTGEIAIARGKSQT